MIGLLPKLFTDRALLRSFPLTTIDLVPVVAAGHLLGTIDGPIATTELHGRIQLVRTDRSAVTAGVTHQI